MFDKVVSGQRSHNEAINGFASVLTHADVSTKNKAIKTPLQLVTAHS